MIIVYIKHFLIKLKSIFAAILLSTLYIQSQATAEGKGALLCGKWADGPPFAITLEKWMKID